MNKAEKIEQVYFYATQLPCGVYRQAITPFTVGVVLPLGYIVHLFNFFCFAHFAAPLVNMFIAALG